MSSLGDALKAHTNSHTVKKFTKVKIYPAIIGEQSKFSPEEKTELTKKGFRWYLYYDYRNPFTGKMERQPPVHLNINRNYPDFDQRRKQILVLRESLKEVLKEGWSPYGDKERPQQTAISCLEFALQLKKHSVGENTYTDYSNRIGHFIKFLTRKGFQRASIEQISKTIINQFLNEVVSNSSSRNRNNHLSVLSAIFSVLEDNELITSDPTKSIKKLDSKPTRNKSYTSSLTDRIFEYLEINDPYLLLYIRIVSYNFLRPIEVVRLRCEDIDLDERKLTIQSKTKANKIKVIPDLLIDELSKLDLSNPNYFIFTPEDKPGPLETSERDRRGYWGKRFSKVKKKFDLDKDYTIYSFRHTYTMKLYRWLREKYHISETLDRLQLVTGHDSISGLKNYLRTIDAELPEDWSEAIK